MGDIEPSKPGDHGRFDPILKVAMWSVGTGITVLAILAVLAYTIPWEGFWRGAGQPYATTLAALAAISAAAIALHNSRSQLDEVRAQRNQDQARYEDERRRDDRKDLRDQFAKATEQLAHVHPTVRRSGVYAMVALLEDWQDIGDAEQATVCARVLTAYLLSPNPTYSELTDGDPTAGDDGPIRALIVSLLSGLAAAGNPAAGAAGLLEYADLRAVVFTGSVRRLPYPNAYLSYADFTRSTHLEGIFAPGAYLSRANLTRANLRDATLTAADLRGALLQNVDFSGADLRHADLRGAKLDNSTFDRVKYSTATKWPAEFSPAELKEPPYPGGSTQ